MSAALYPVFENPLKGGDDFCGKGLSGALEVIDAWAEAQQRAPLSFFFGNMDLDELLVEDRDDEDAEDTDTDSEPGPWFAADEGRRLVQALLADANAMQDPLLAAARDDLETLDRLLAAAQAKGLGWNLQVDC